MVFDADAIIGLSFRARIQPEIWEKLFLALWYTQKQYSLTEPFGQ